MVALLSLSSLVHATQFRDCDDGLQLICADGDSLAPVDSTVFAGNPIFNKHFTVFLCWEPGAPGATGAPGSRWDEDDLREFANIVVDSLAGDVSGMAKSILDYFGEDAFASVDTLFGIQTKTGAPAGQDTTYTHFGIYIFDTCRVINATHEYVTAHIEGQDGQFLTPWEVARDAFAHEWQHVCHHSWQRVDRSTSIFESFDEMCSVLSASKYGLDGSDTHTSPYDTPVSNNGSGSHYASACQNAVPVTQDSLLGSGCLSRFGNVYNDWAMFAIYLDNVFTLPGEALEDSLVYRWIRTYTEDEGHRTYLHNFPGLGIALDVPDLDAFFSSSSASPHQRVNEVFRAYGLAKFLNLQSPTSDEEIYQWLGEGDDPDGYQPQALYNFLQDSNGVCYDNIQAFPPYHTCSSDRQVVSGWQFSSDYWPTDCDADDYSWFVPEWNKRRLVGVQTFASNYLVFQPPDTSGVDLSVSFRFLDEYPCMICPTDPDSAYALQSVTAAYEGKVRLAVDLIGYDLPFAPDDLDPRDNGLDVYGERKRSIETHWIEPAPGQVVDFNVTDFGKGNSDAVALVLTLVPKEGVAGNLNPIMLPYEYRFQTVPDTVVSLPDTIGGTDCHVVVEAGETAWVDGEVRILPGCDLTVEEGARVYFRSATSKIVADGGSLLVRGTAEAPVEFLPSILPGDTNTDYAGLFAENLGLLDLDYCRLNDAEKIAADSALVRISYSTLYLADTNDNAIVLDLQNGPREPALEYCEIPSVNRIWIDSGVGRSAEIANCTISQRENFQSLLSLPPPLVYCMRGTLSVSNTEMYFLRTGIQIGEKFMPHQPLAYLGPGLAIAPHPLASSPEAGVVCRGTATVEAQYCDVRLARVGAKVWDSAALSLAHVDIHQCDYGLINYAWSGTVDLGAPGQSAGGNFIAPLTTSADCWTYVQGTPASCYEDAAEVEMVRIYNATTNVIPAEGNAWGTCEGFGEDYGIDCMCPDAFFKPDSTRVDFGPWTAQNSLFACGTSPTDPGFYIGIESAAPPPEGAWPNPFNGQIHFRYRAPGAPARLQVFDILGREVRRLSATIGENGDQLFIWRGDSEQGQPVSSGVYLYRIVGEAKTLKGKVIYVK
ncbi:MAG: T9SS type A sorting domain-containing protein [Candidatus Krumholzibacteriia bacterium]